MPYEVCLFLSKRVIQNFQNLAQKDEPVELMVHPGYPSDPGTGGLPVPDEFSLSTDRQFELDMLKDLAPQFEIIIPS